MTEIILGPPGTGKTTALLAIVEEELTAGTPPDKIGYVSFTRRAADEAITRACRLFNLVKSDFPWFRTLHSLCFAGLGLSSGDVFEGAKMVEFGDWIGIPLKGFVSMDEGSFSGFERGDRILFMYNLARVRGIGLRQLYDQNDDGLYWAEVERVARGLEEYKAANHLVDYTDMLSMYVDRCEPPDLDTLLVDESQDLSTLQWRVVDKLAEKARRVVVAGDDDQAIYVWAGANVDLFVKMRGRVRILQQSWRVPETVQKVASRVVSRIENRRTKEWRPRADSGIVQRLANLDQANFSGEDVLVLARNVYLLNEVEHILRHDGIIYSLKGRGSVSEGILRAVVSWERLRRGETVAREDAVKMYEYISSGNTGVARGHKQLPDIPPGAEVSEQDLRSIGGLMATGIWHEALDKIPEGERAYMLRALRKGHRLLSKPRVRLSTIHGAKGGEADHVILLTDMAARTHHEMSMYPDDEARVWYVAVTRARHKLSIIDPRTRRNFQLY